MHHHYEAIPENHHDGYIDDSRFARLRRKISNHFQNKSFLESNVAYEEETPKKNIVSYDIRALLRLGWMVPLRGSVCNLKLIATVMFQAVVTTVLALSKCEEGRIHCIPLPHTYTGLTLLTITSFLLGIFVNNVLQRWWNIRVALGTVMIKSKSLALSVASSVAIACIHASPDIKQQAVDYVHKIKRYLNLAHALIYRTHDKDANLTDLLELGVVTPLEANMLQDNMLHASGSSYTKYSAGGIIIPSKMPSTLHLSSHSSSFEGDLPNDADAVWTAGREDVPSITGVSLPRVTGLPPAVLLCFQVYGWIKLSLEEGGRAGLFGGAAGQMPQHVVSLFIDLATIEASAAQVDMYVGIQLPYPFVQMSIITIYMFTLQLIVVCAGMIGEGLQTHDASLVFGGYMTCFMLTFVIMGVLHLYTMLAVNPVGDMPAQTYMLVEEAELQRLTMGLWESASATENGRLAIVPELNFDHRDLVKPVAV